MEKTKGIVFLGNSGAGKGTLIESLSDYKQFYHFSTGDMFRYLKRSKDTDLGRHIDSVLQRGGYIDDSTTMDCLDYFISCMKERRKDAFADTILKGRVFEQETGIIVFDGVPRTLPQAEALDLRFNILKAVYVNTPEDVCEERLKKRGREDDLNPYTRNARFESFRINALPIAEKGYYNRRMGIIDGNAAKQDMTDAFIRMMVSWGMIQ